MSRCSKEAWCPAMSERLNEGERAGFSVLTLMNFKSGEARVGGVLFKRSRRDRGIMLNVCPWCASAIFWIGRDKDPQRAETSVRHEKHTADTEVLA
jgi:hypothetical protein